MEATSKCLHSETKFQNSKVGTQTALETLLFKTIAKVSQPVVVLNACTRESYLTNQAFLDVTGLDEGNLKFGPCNFLTEADNQIFSRCLEECSTKQTGADFRIFHEKKNSSLMMNASFEAIPYDEKSHLVSVVFDPMTTDEREELRWLRILDAFSDSAMFIFEYHPEISDVLELFWTRKASEYLGFTTTPKGKFASKYFNGPSNCEERDLGYSNERINPMIESFQRLKDGKKVDEIERVSGEAPHKVMVVTSYPLATTPQGHLQVVCMMKDKSEIMGMRHQLEQNESKLQHSIGMNDVLRKFFDSAPVQMGVVTVMPNEKDVVVESLNPVATAQILGGVSLEAKTAQLGLEKMSGIKLGFSEDDLGLWIVKYREAQREQKGVQFEYLPQEHPDVAWSVTVSHVSGDRFVWMAQDISQARKITEQLKNHKEELEKLVWERTRELEDALRVKSRFLAVMSHEMRTPLSGLMGMISVLEETRLNGEQRTMLNTAQTCSRQLLALINDVLDLTKLEENKVELEKAPFCIQTVVEEAVQVVSLEAEKKNLEVVCDTGTALPPVVIGDATRIRQIVVNLAGNSVKFSFKGEILIKVRPVTPSTESSHITIEFMVKDEGIGIKESAKDALFQPFTQADTSITRKFGGSGLGLNISHQLVKLMKGDIWFESKEGNGTTFFFSIKLPLAPPSLEPTPSDSFDLRRSQILHGEFYTMRFSHLQEHEVFIVEPSKALMDVLQRTIAEEWNFKSTCFSSWTEATEFLDTNQPPKGIVFLDSKFGIEVINKFVTKYLQLYFVVMGYSHIRVEERTRVGFLKKPVCKGTNAKDIGSLYQLFASFYDHLTNTSTEPSKPLTPPVSDGKRKSSFSASDPEPKRRGSLVDEHLVSPSNSLNFGESENTPSPPEMRHQHAVPNGPQLSILLAEDNQMNQFVIKKLLETMNFTNITIVDNGKLCLDALHGRNYDVILMDVMMPEMDGIEATIRIRKDFPANLQPVIVAVSANAFVEDRVRCLEAGMNDVLTKPINRAKMREILVRCLTAKLNENT